MPVPPSSLPPFFPAWTFWILLLAHLGTTWAMTGLIWFVQVVHYPLLARLGDAYFRPYHRMHCERTGYVVGPLMFVELSSAAALVYLLGAGTPARTAAWAGLLLLGIIWASTALLQIPQHNRLGALGPDPATLRALLRGNWLRTAAWTLRAVLVVPCLTWLALNR